MSGPLGTDGDNRFRGLRLPDGFGRAIDYASGEIITQVGPDCYEVDHFEKLSNRYFCRATAGKLLRGYRNGDKPIYRICRCGHIMSQSRGVDLYRSLVARSAHYSGLVTCGSIWHCPVCALKIASRRCAELTIGTQRHHEQGGVCGLLTCTSSHGSDDRLQDVMELVQGLYRLLLAGRDGENIRGQYGLIGQVRSIEITRGFNGWHPHIHALVFAAEPIDWQSLQERLYLRWSATARKKYGLDLPRLSLDLRCGDAAANYISKWSIEAELTQSMIKQGRNGSLTPWSLLCIAANGDTAAGNLWTEFATTVSRPTANGRVSSARQLVWSRGLKDRFSLRDRSDEEIAEEQIEPSVLLGNLTYEQWQRVRAQPYDARVVVLQLATTGTFDDVQRYVDSLPDYHVKKPLQKNIRNLPICAAAKC